MINLDYWEKKLKIKTIGELFVLKWLLNRDKGRYLILLDIKEIRLKHNLINIKCTTRNSSYSFSVSNIEGKGWLKSMNQYDKESYVTNDLIHKVE